MLACLRSPRRTGSTPAGRRRSALARADLSTPRAMSNPCSRTYPRLAASSPSSTAIRRRSAGWAPSTATAPARLASSILARPARSRSSTVITASTPAASSRQPKRSRRASRSGICARFRGGAARNWPGAPSAGAAPVEAAKVSASKPRRRRMVEFFCGLDVAIEETAVCVVDDRGEVHLTVKVTTEPEALFAALKPFVARLRRVGHEAGSLSPWLHPELLKLGLPVICLETQHVRAAMSAQRNKTDEKDALGIAHIMRTGWFRAAHVKSEECYRMRLLLTHRRNLKRKFLDLENAEIGRAHV